MEAYMKEYFEKLVTADDMIYGIVERTLALRSGPV